MSLPESPGKKDRRLYAKFDIGMDEHTKIMFLSDAAFRALFESTLYSRRQLTDGFLDERVVKRKWGAEVAAELSSNDAERPSWIPVDGGYMIHDFAEHQTTTADIERKREAGRKGGLAKAKQDPSTTEAPAKHVLDECSSKSLAKTETETETDTKTPLKDLSSKQDEFIDWYLEYPRKASKGMAEKAYAKARKIASAEELIEGAIRYREDPNREPSFTKLPATWLNGKCWEDGPLPPRNASQPQQRMDHSARGLAKGMAMLQAYDEQQRDLFEIEA